PAQPTSPKPDGADRRPGRSPATAALTPHSPWTSGSEPRRSEQRHPARTARESPPLRQKGGDAGKPLTAFPDHLALTLTWENRRTKAPRVDHSRFESIGSFPARVPIDHHV